MPAPRRLVPRRSLFLVLAGALPLACSSADGAGAVTVDDFLACLAERDVDARANADLGEVMAVDGDVVQVSVGAGAIVVVDADADAASRTFDALGDTIGAGASPEDFFRDGNVTVLFSEQSQPEQGELLRDCVG